ncbi:MAG: Ig-like domain repeat protein, partial [Methanosphaera sp.]|nr:Ig-like domain repeat protein [Methanosphaera sp.]
TLTIEKCKFQNAFRDSRQAKGGFIYNKKNLTVKDCIFDNDTASWGASIYTDNAQTLIINTNFTNSETINVGGAVYSIRSKTEIYNSTFMYNKGVSGAAIYNAFGNLTVNNTLFFKNDAQHFYGGAIYNTGRTITNNSVFIANHATYDGGAITNTHHFLSTNCTYESNVAGAQGGAIQNIAMSENELGNLTLINTTFLENSATTLGGAISNKLMTDLTICGIITAKDSVFLKNTAGEEGGAIYNLKYINAEYNVFADNSDDNNQTIVSKKENIISLENNWWGCSNPIWDDIGYQPKEWIVANYTNTSTFIRDYNTDVIVSLDKTNKGRTITERIPERKVIFYGDNNTYKLNNLEITKNVTNEIIVRSNASIAQIDNDILTLTPVDSKITYTLSNRNQTINIKVNLPKNINGKINLKLNGKTINSSRVVNGTYTYRYDIPTELSKDKYTLNTIIQTKDGKTLQKNITITIPKRNVTSTVTIKNSTPIEAGSTIEITATIKLGNTPVNHGYVIFKINNQTFSSKVNVVNGTAKTTYTLAPTLKAKDYQISIVYSGDSNKNSNRNVTTLSVKKHTVHVNIDSLDLFADSENPIRIYFYDSNNNYIPYGQAAYKINGITINSTLSIDEGVIIITIKTPRVKDGETLKQTMTLKVGENNNHYAMSKDIDLFIS